MRHIWILLGILLTCGGMAGCGARGGDAPMSAGPPLGLQMVRTEAQMRKYPFRAIQPFEQGVDLAFIDVDGPAAAIDGRHAHTGASSAAIAAGTRSVTVRLASLMSGQPWPGQWTLAGAYFFSERPQRMSAVYEIEGRAVLTYPIELPANQWTPVLLDIASIVGSDATKAGTIAFRFGAGTSGNVWCDDVILFDNTEAHVEEPAAGGGWSVRERGFAFFVERSGAFKVSLAGPEASEKGWVLDEANAVRAVFIRPGGGAKRYIYEDGRELEGGRMQSLKNDADSLAQHASPGRVVVGAELGRLNQTSVGDANNDGYNEVNGAYQLIATGSRIDFTIEPNPAKLFRPVMEISGLPAGTILVTMEGLLVERTVRLKDGRVLMELPGVIGRATSVNVRVLAEGRGN